MSFRNELLPHYEAHCSTSAGPTRRTFGLARSAEGQRHISGQGCVGVGGRGGRADGAGAPFRR
eukprot:scaffold29659_cov57-Phaeocystis_antarctica.AAC.2